MDTIVANIRFLCSPKTGYGLGYSLGDTKFYVFQLSPGFRYNYGVILDLKAAQQFTEVSYEQAAATFQKVVGHTLTKDGKDSMERPPYRVAESSNRVVKVPAIPPLTPKPASVTSSESVAESPPVIPEPVLAEPPELVTVEGSLVNPESPPSGLVSSPVESGSNPALAPVELIAPVESVDLADPVESTPASKKRRGRPRLFQKADSSAPTDPGDPVEDITALLPQPKKPQSDMGATVFQIIRYGGFGLASIISALFNIFLFTSLDPSYIWLLVGFSIALEFTKVSSIVGAHLFRDLYVKTGLKRLVGSMITWYAFYFVLAAFSIVASLGFSLTVTARTSDSYVFQEDSLRRDKAMIQARHDAISAKLAEISSTSDAAKLTIDTYPPYQSANESYQAALLAYNEKNAAYRAVSTRTVTELEDSARYAAETTAINKAYSELTAATTARNNAKSERDAIESRFNRAQSDSATVLAELNVELSALIAQAGLDPSTSGSVALIDLSGQMGDLDRQIAEIQETAVREKGMGYMFEQFAGYLHTDSKWVKLIILMFASLCLEITIFSSSPDIHLSRKILRFFRYVLPRELDLPTLIAQIDEDEHHFSSV